MSNAISPGPRRLAHSTLTLSIVPTPARFPFSAVRPVILETTRNTGTIFKARIWLDCTATGRKVQIGKKKARKVKH
jgi:hypothetical protein